MNIENKEIRSLQKFVSKDFVDSNHNSLIPDNDFQKLEEFRNYLIDKLSELIDSNYNLLINTLYRIDINEKKLAELFGGKNRENIPERLADLIIERQIQKIKLRQKYREGKI